MAKKNRVSDEILEQILGAIQKYKQDHPRAQTKVYRHSPVAVRARIIDPDFTSMSKFQRHDLVWNYLNKLSEETINEISLLLLLSPKEADQSLANAEFDDPLPSLL